jgi:hypothetical protein
LQDEYSMRPIWPAVPLASTAFIVFLASAAQSANDQLPAEVRDLVSRREQCRHWAGEEPYDKARARQIEEAIKRLRCEDVEMEVEAIRQKYATNALIQAALPKDME